MKLKVLKHIYILAAIAIVFASAKYVFLDHYIKTPFYIFEFISFLVFLCILYLMDNMIRKAKKTHEDDTNYIEKLKMDHEEKMDHLTKQVNELLSSQRKGSEEVSETEILIANIKKDIEDTENDSRPVELKVLYVLSHYFEVVLGIYYSKKELSEDYVVKGCYGLGDDCNFPDLKQEDGVHAQVIKDGEPMVLSDIDENYFDVESCSGSGKPKNIYFLPVKRNDEILGLIEIATFKSISILDYWESINEFFVNSDLI